MRRSGVKRCVAWYSDTTSSGSTGARVRTQWSGRAPDMLVLCYGITKSGSTLTFELIKGVLETSGNPQQRLPDGPVNPDHRINYVQPLNRKRLKELVSAVGESWI